MKKAGEGMMSLPEAAALFATPARVKALAAMLADSKMRHGALAGLRGSSAAMVFGLLPRKTHPLVIVADDADTAGYLYHDLSRVAPSSEVGFFPSGYKRHIKYGRVDAPQQILRAETLDGWRAGRLRFVVTYPDALAERVPVREVLERYPHAKVGRKGRHKEDRGASARTRIPSGGLCV